MKLLVFGTSGQVAMELRQLASEARSVARRGGSGGSGRLLRRHNRQRCRSGDQRRADFAGEILRQAGLPVQGIATADYPTPAARPMNSRLDCSSLTADFGIERPDWSEALGQVLRELETQG